MDISRILTFSSPQTLRSISRISGWVAGAIERKIDGERGIEIDGGRPVLQGELRYFANATLPSKNRVLGRRRSSARRGTLAYSPSPGPSSFHFGERRRSIRAVESLSRPESRDAGDDDVGRWQSGSAVGAADFRILRIPVDERERKREKTVSI